MTALASGWPPGGCTRATLPGLLEMPLVRGTAQKGRVNPGLRATPNRGKVASCFLVVIVFADKLALACGGLSVYTKFCTPPPTLI